MADMFEPLYREGLIRRGKISSDVFNRKTQNELLDIIDEVTAETIDFPKPAALAGKLHCASIGLGGGTSDCAAIGCRRQRINELARFSAMYSDHVLIHNFIGDLSPTFGHAPDEEDDETRDRLFVDIFLLNELRPLIDAGIIIPYATPHVYCPACFVGKAVSKEMGSRVDQARRLLSRDIFDSIEVKLELLDDEIFVILEGDTPYLEHGSVVYRYADDDLRPASDNKRLMSRLRKGETVSASKDLRKRMDFHGQLAHDIISSVSYQLGVSHMTGAEIVTHKKSELITLNRISKDSELADRNAMLERNWSGLIPFAGEVPISKLLTLRKREAESFTRYRSALDSAVKEALGPSTELTDVIARAIYADILAPEIARLNQTVKAAKRDLIIDPLSSAAAIFATLVIGTYAGLLPSELGPIANALGMSKVVYDTIRSASRNADTKRGIRSENYYYLWKVSHSAQAARGS